MNSSITVPAGKNCGETGRVSQPFFPFADETPFVLGLNPSTRPSCFDLCFVLLHQLTSMSWQLAYAVLSGLLVLLNSVPLYWQFVQGNSGPIAMGVWVVLTNVIEFVRALILRYKPIEN